MKRIVSLLLSVVFLMSAFSVVSFAEEPIEEEIYNVARVENALPYASSEKNTLWTPARALNDGLHNSDTWQGWECKYPNIISGSDTSKGFSGEYFGIKFTNKEYYEIHSININLGLHAAMGGQNAHFLVQCLVEGVWVTVAEFSDSDTTPVSFSSYEDVMENDTSYYHVPSNYSVTLETPVTTNNVRVTLSGYAKNYPGGDVLIFPYVYEIELMGKRGETPDLELPEGAVISTNVGYHSYATASSSNRSRYPYCAIDGKTTSYWAPSGLEAGEYLCLTFPSVKNIDKAVVSFGTYLSGSVYTDYKFDIEALVDGAWVTVASGHSLYEEDETLISEYSFTAVDASALRIKFTEGYKKSPTVYELEAHMSAEKTYYVEDRYDSFQRASASKGNIAFLGTPYANRDFAPYSDINYIIDGLIDENAYVWFTGVIDMPSYCGVKFDEKRVINKVALYFPTPTYEGEDIMGIQIQAKIDGEYVTIVDTKSYHSELKYEPAFEFDPVETDDIRIYFTSGNGTFAHLRELEIYSPDGVDPMFNGITSLATPPTFIDVRQSAENEGVIENTSHKVDAPKVEENSNVLVPNGELTAESETGFVYITVICGAAVVLAALAVAFVRKRKNNK